MEVLSIQKQAGIGAVLIEVIEKQKTRINKKHNRCGNYEQPENFHDCVKKDAWNNMKRTFRCKLPGSEEFIPKNVSLDECHDRLMAKETLESFTNGTFSFKSVSKSRLKFKLKFLVHVIYFILLFFSLRVFALLLVLSLLIQCLCVNCIPTLWFHRTKLIWGNFMLGLFLDTKLFKLMRKLRPTSMILEVF